MISWLFDNTPWWLYLLMAGGGGGVVLAFFPGVLAFVIGIYKAMPVWLRWITGMAIVAAIAHIMGRNIAAANARAAQKRLDERATDTAKKVTHEVDKLKPDEVDKRLEDNGGFWDDDEPERGGKTGKPPPVRPPPRTR